MRQVHSSGSGPFARSVDADHVPKVLRKFARPGDRHYFYVIDNNGRLYLGKSLRLVVSVAPSLVVVSSTLSPLVVYGDDLHC